MQRNINDHPKQDGFYQTFLVPPMKATDLHLFLNKRAQQLLSVGEVWEEGCGEGAKEESSLEVSASQLGAIRKLGSLFSVSSGWIILDVIKSNKLLYTLEVGGLKSLWNLGEKAGGVQGGRPHCFAAPWQISNKKESHLLISRGLAF